MSVHLVRRWRNSARAWRSLARYQHRLLCTERDGCQPGCPARKTAEHLAVSQVLNECADSLERSLKIGARKREKGVGK